MDKEKQTWVAQVIKWQERVITRNSYSSSSNADYATLEHEALILYCIETGETKTIKHKEE